MRRQPTGRSYRLRPHPRDVERLRAGDAAGLERIRRRCAEFARVLHGLLTQGDTRDELPLSTRLDLADAALADVSGRFQDGTPLLRLEDALEGRLEYHIRRLMAALPCVTLGRGIDLIDGRHSRVENTPPPTDEDFEHARRMLDVAAPHIEAAYNALPKAFRSGLALFYGLAPLGTHFDATPPRRRTTKARGRARRREALARFRAALESQIADDSDARRGDPRVLDDVLAFVRSSALMRSLALVRQLLPDSPLEPSPDESRRRKKGALLLLRPRRSPPPRSAARPKPHGRPAPAPTKADSPPPEPPVP